MALDLNKQETALVLAGLRLLQDCWSRGRDIPTAINDILADGGADKLDVEDIDPLCEDVNFGVSDRGERQLNVIATLRARLAGWVEIADEEDKRELDDVALDEATAMLREAGREV